MTDEFIQIENFQSVDEKNWLNWINEVEKTAGHSIDGDQSRNGYSLGHAYDKFKEGWQPLAYYQWHVKPTPTLVGLRSVCSF